MWTSISPTWPGVISYTGMCSWCLSITYPCLFSSSLIPLMTTTTDQRRTPSPEATLPSHLPSTVSYTPQKHLQQNINALASCRQWPCVFMASKDASPRRNVIRALLHDFVSKTVLGLPNSLSRLQGLNRRRIAARCPSLAGALVIFAGSLPVSLFFFLKPVPISPFYVWQISRLYPTSVSSAASRFLCPSDDPEFPTLQFQYTYYFDFRRRSVQSCGYLRSFAFDLLYSLLCNPPCSLFIPVFYVGLYIGQTIPSESL